MLLNFIPLLVISYITEVAFCGTNRIPLHYKISVIICYKNSAMVPGFYYIRNVMLAEFQYITLQKSLYVTRIALQCITVIVLHYQNSFTSLTVNYQDLVMSWNFIARISSHYENSIMLPEICYVTGNLLHYSISLHHKISVTLP